MMSVTVSVSYTNERSFHGDGEWDDSSSITCSSCHERGTVEEFTTARWKVSLENPARMHEMLYVTTAPDDLQGWCRVVDLGHQDGEQAYDDVVITLVRFPNKRIEAFVSELARFNVHKAQRPTLATA
jgi:hypothetical protein